MCMSEHGSNVMVTHSECQRERQAASAAASIAHSGVFQSALLIQPSKSLVNSLLVPCPDVQLDLLQMHNVTAESLRWIRK